MANGAAVYVCDCVCEYHHLTKLRAGLAETTKQDSLTIAISHVRLLLLDMATAAVTTIIAAAAATATTTTTAAKIKRQQNVKKKLSRRL